MVSISDPAAIPDVYPMRPGFPKVGNYLLVNMIYTFQPFDPHFGLSKYLRLVLSSIYAGIVRNLHG
jgi:hypothetical protein